MTQSHPTRPLPTRFRRHLMARHGVARATSGAVIISMVASATVAALLAPVLGARLNYAVGMATMMPALVSPPLYIIIFTLIRRLFGAEDELVRLATIDGLTQCYSRAHFLALADDALQAARRDGREFSLLLIDFDHFKRVNDEHGHDAGDRALRELGAVLRAKLRGGDFLGRLGGEEFAAVLPGASASVAHAAAERMREAVAAA